MNDLFIGNTITGNFSPRQPVKDLEGYKVEKQGNSLSLVKGVQRILLDPLGEEADIVVNSFSDETGDDNESIYKLEPIKENIAIILYVYTGNPVKILGTQRMTIYLGTALEHQMLSDEGIKLGRTTLKINSSDELKPLLEDTFMNNRSIFINLNNRNRRNDSFTMFGKHCRADVVLERTGIYRIDRFYQQRNEQYAFTLTQIFGNIDFATYKEQAAIPSSDSTPLSEIHTSQIFQAWTSYMDFESKEYEERLQAQKFIRYKNFSVKSLEVIFKLEEAEQAYDSDTLKNNEWEFINTQQSDPLPSNNEELVRLKQDRNFHPIYLGACLNDVAANTLSFEIPNTRFFDNADPDKPGIIYLSDQSLRREQRRRKRVVSMVDSKSNESANFILRLSSKDVKDTQTGTDYKPVNADVLFKMFGKKDVTLSENYRKAMDIALNTPDIALIQGPPGTGKTTLIKGLVARLNMMNKDYRILVSSEQHEALKNVVDKLSGNRLIPPYVSSKRYDQDETIDEDSQDRIIRNFQDSFVRVCENILREDQGKSKRSSNLTGLVSAIQKIKDANYSLASIKENIDEITRYVQELNCASEVNDELSALRRLIETKSDSSVEVDAVTKLLQSKVEAQRTTIQAYEDDGRMQMEILQSMLDSFGYEDLKMSDSLYGDLESDNPDKVKKAFPEYVAYVDKVRNALLPKELGEFDEQPDGAETILTNLRGKVEKKISKEPMDFPQIVEALLYRLNDIDSAADIIKAYTSVIGSTCAQAGQSIDAVDLGRDKYDVVIVDEAARANPLDLMIPIMMGVRVILIGDHKQLPHYIESNMVRQFNKEEKQRSSEYDETLLEKSLFELIYENLDTAWKEGRIKYQRTIRINEQFRMNPTIGNYISSEFYDGDVKNAPSTANKVNDYNVLNGKNVAWLDVPLREGFEERAGQSLCREAEADRIVCFVSSLVSKNPQRKIDLGIISFYSGQVNLLRTKLKESFPDVFTNPIDDMCNTVDSYQGKEFDIVIVSGVRSNNEPTPQKALGFIQYSDSRVNVALSRARKLLVFVGDRGTYEKNPHFRNFLSYVKKEGYYE